MKDTDYDKIIELTPVGGGFLPANERAEELLLSSHPSEVLSFLEVTARDLKFHRAYFSLIHYIHDCTLRKRTVTGLYNVSKMNIHAF